MAYSLTRRNACERRSLGHLLHTIDAVEIRRDVSLLLEVVQTLEWGSGINKSALESRNYVSWSILFGCHRLWQRKGRGHNERDPFRGIEFRMPTGISSRQQPFLNIRISLYTQLCTSLNKLIKYCLLPLFISLYSVENAEAKIRRLQTN